MKRTNRHGRQNGAALIIGLILLSIITLLAVVGMNIANSELASATSEQIRLRAAQAAETGLEHGLVGMLDSPTIPGKDFTVGPTPVVGSPLDSDKNAIDTYTTTITYRGESTPPGYSAQTFSGFNYSVVSKGASSRSAVMLHEQGAYKINTNSQPSFGSILP